MEPSKCLKMVQINKYRWKLVAPKGHILVEDLSLGSPYLAEEWVKAYISSWTTYSYVIILMKG